GRDLYFSGPGGMWTMDMAVTADHIDFVAGGSIIDRAVNGTRLTATAGDIRLTAEAGAARAGMLSAPAGRTIYLTQAQSKYIGAGPYGFIADPERTSLVVRITDGFLVFGGEFGGVHGDQKLLSVDARASEFLRVEDDLTIGSFADLRS